MSNKDLASIFSKIALYLEIDDVPFKPQAYERVAGAIEALQESVSTKEKASKGSRGFPE